MLVSVLVLGVMGCGKKNLETGNEIPFALHGTWVNGSTDLSTPHFIITANEFTVRIPNAAAAGGTVQYAFRAEFGGNKNNPAAQQVTLKLTRIVDGVEWGTYRFTYAGNEANPNAPLVTADTLVVADPVPTWQTSLVPYYEFYQMFIVGTTYTRAGQ